MFTRSLALLVLWLLWMWFLWSRSVSGSLHLDGCLSSSFSFFCHNTFFFLSLSTLLCLWSFFLSHCSFWNACHIKTLEQTSWAVICPACLEGYLACNKHVIGKHYYYFLHLCCQLSQVVSRSSKQGNIADWRETWGEKNIMGWGKQRHRPSLFLLAVQFLLTSLTRSNRRWPRRL